MSLVRISKNLIAEVEASIARITAKAYEATVAPKNPKNVPECVAAMLEAGNAVIWTKYPQYKDSLPPEWYVSVNRMDVHIIELGREEFQINATVKAPPGSSSYGYIDVDVSLKDLPLNFKQLLDEYGVAKAKHKETYDKVKQQLMSFLRSSKSLNAALTTFPDLALYIPKTYLDQVATKVTRSKSGGDTEDAAPVTIDTNLLTSIGVVGRLQN